MKCQDNRSTETQSKLVILYFWAEGWTEKIQGLTVHRYEDFGEDDEKVMQLDYGCCCTTVNVLKYTYYTVNCYSKQANFMLHELFLNRAIRKKRLFNSGTQYQGCTVLNKAVNNLCRCFA